MRLALTLAVLLTAGCDLNIFGPEVGFVNRRPLDPVPAVFPLWYAAVAECLKLPGRYEAVRWFVADEIWYEGGLVAGRILGDEVTVRADRIISSTPRHEASHHITGAGNWLHDADDRMPCEDASIH